MVRDISPNEESSSDQEVKDRVKKVWGDSVPGSGSAKATYHSTIKAGSALPTPQKNPLLKLEAAFPGPSDQTIDLQTGTGSSLPFPDVADKSKIDTETGKFTGRKNLETSVTLRRIGDKETLVGLDTFNLEGELGQGGMGIVRLARQESLNREVAVKTLKDEASYQNKDAFIHEGMLTGELTHPNIVPVHLFASDSQGRRFMVMKRIEGKPWSAILEESLFNTILQQDPPKPSGSSTRLPSGASGRRMPPSTVLNRHIEIFLKVCDAVSFSHAHGIIHRDLKPSNVMVGDFGEVTVMDWGLAMRCDTKINVPEVPEVAEEPLKKRVEKVGPAGTPAYMAPEMALGRLDKIGASTDVYLLGAILFEIVTGLPPHTGTTPLEVITHAATGIIEPIQPRTGLPREGRALERIIRRALAPKPTKRYPSVMALQEDVRAFLAGQGDRHESEMLVQESRRELDKIRKETVDLRQVSPYYARCVDLLAKADRAVNLWSFNPRAVRLRQETLAFYADLSLRGRDWGLAESVLRELVLSGSGGSNLAAPMEKRLKEERDTWERKNYLLNRAARVGAVAALLFAAIIVALILHVGNLQNKLDHAGIQTIAPLPQPKVNPTPPKPLEKDQKSWDNARFVFSKGPRKFLDPFAPPPLDPTKMPPARLVDFIPSPTGSSLVFWDGEGRLWLQLISMDGRKRQAVPLGFKDETDPVGLALWLGHDKLFVVDGSGRMRSGKNRDELKTSKPFNIMPGEELLAGAFVQEKSREGREKILVAILTNRNIGVFDQTAGRILWKQVLAKGMDPITVAAVTAKDRSGPSLMVLGKDGLHYYAAYSGISRGELDFKKRYVLADVPSQGGALVQWSEDKPDKLHLMDPASRRFAGIQVPPLLYEHLIVSQDGKSAALSDDQGNLVLVVLKQSPGRKKSWEITKVSEQRLRKIKFSRDGKRIFVLEDDPGKGSYYSGWNIEQILNKN